MEFDTIEHGVPLNKTLLTNARNFKNQLTDIDFFIKKDNVSSKNHKNSKKKKVKKKHQSKLLMDLINAELATQPLFVENVIKFNENKEQNNCVREFFTTRYENRAYDAEKGMQNRHREIAKLIPTFPGIIENTSRRDGNALLNYVAPVFFPDFISLCSGDELRQRPKFLDIVIKDLKILYHHDFTLEILLCIKLDEIFKIYQNNRKDINNLLKEIAVNRKTRNNVKEHMLKICPSKKDEIRFDKIILKYTQMMLQLKEKYYIACKVNKQVIHQMMSLWADIEVTRSKSGFTKSPHMLQITKEELNDDELKNEWFRLFEEEYSDMLIKLEYEYIVKYLEYKEWKQGDKEKRDIKKPKLHINHEELKNTVESIVNSILVRNRMDIALIKKHPKIIPNSSYRHNYFFKVYVDDVFVCQSDEYYEKGQFKEIDFVELFSVQILPTNRNIEIILFEDNHRISSKRIELHKITKVISDAYFGNEIFTSNKSIEPSSKRVGSGYSIKNIAAEHMIRLKSNNLFEGKLFNAYESNIKIGWNEKMNTNDDKIKSFVNLRTSVNRLLLGKIKPSVNVLLEVISNIYDRNIINDEKIKKALRQVCEEKITVENILPVPINFNKRDKIRFKLLNLRNLSKLFEVNNLSIPLQASQISTSHLDHLLSNSDMEVKPVNFEESTAMNTIDLQRFMGVRQITRLNKKILETIHDFLLKKTYKDVVRDFEDLSLRSIFTYQPRFNLNATSTLTKQGILRSCLKQEQEISITVLRAHNLLDRILNTDCEDNQNKDDIAGFKVRPLRPFVRIIYHGASHRTPTAVGCHPTWNHTVILKTKLEPLSCIYINLYDERQVNVISSESEQCYQYRKHASWLGSIEIPLRTVLETGCLRGAFKVTTPTYTFNYEVFNETKMNSDIMQILRTDTSLLLLNISTGLSHLAGQSYNLPIPSNTKDDLQIRHLNTFVSDYLNDFPSRNISLTFIDSSGTNKIITEFLQPIPVPDMEYFPRDPKKIGSALSKSSGQSKSSSSKSSQRKSIEKEDDLLAKRHDSWKKDEYQLNNIMDAVIRYVSLIPAYEVLESHVVTLMGVELLKVMYGSPLDHTILLASYFIYLGIKCYVITGWGLPRGISSYVLVQFNQNRVITINEDVKKRFWTKNDGSIWYVYEAVSGERYDLREVGCPLKTVSHVFDNENIWVNVQSSQDCENMSFDLTKSSNWQPVFNRPMFLTKPIEHSYIVPSDVEGLRSSLEMKIKTKIQKWRSHVKTVWNRYCSGLLREMLPHWEYWAFNSTKPRPSPGHRLKQLMLSYKIFGFPLNMPYVNPKLIASRIKSTALHDNDDPNVEFGIAVEVYPYPNDVLSVWVFLVSIVKNDD